MQKCASLLVCLFAIMVSSAFAGINVTSPSNNSTVPSPTHFAATAGSTSCSKGVASMGVYSSPGVLAYTQNGTSLDTNLSLQPGTYNTTVQQWDYCGGSDSKNVTVTVTSSTGVTVTSPANGSSSTSPVKFAATATTSCSKGVASMGIYPTTGNKAYVSNGATLSTNLSLSPGTYNATVEEWDNCGGASTSKVTVTVTSGGSGGGGSSFSNLQESSGWETYGEYPPDYAICSSCGSGVTWSMQQKISSPSLSGHSTKYTIGGDTPYSDVLWVNHLIGPDSTQGMPDNNETVVPTLYNFTYDTYFYGTDLALSENMEFDLGQFFDNKGLMFGLQCQIVNGSVWGLWDGATNHWNDTKIPCKPLSNYWNHVTFVFTRTSDDQVYYNSVTLNGVTTNINVQYPNFKAEGWYGLVLNFQLDGNYKQSDYSVYLDNLTVDY